jgi:hypothetical protein
VCRTTVLPHLYLQLGFLDVMSVGEISASWKDVGLKQLTNDQASMLDYVIDHKPWNH